MQTIPFEYLIIVNSNVKLDYKNESVRLFNLFAMLRSNVEYFVEKYNMQTLVLSASLIRSTIECC